VLEELLTRDFPVPELRGDGIVTTGEGRYEHGIVVGIKILRDVLKCKLPVKIFHKLPWTTDMSKWDVELINTTELQAIHPSQNYGGWQSKSYGVIHSGFKRVLFLDADAYCVKDPTPLFKLLNKNDHYLYWGDYGPGSACAPIPNELPEHQNGGEYLVDLEAFWKEYNLIRYLDENSHIFYRYNVIGDECSTRWVRSMVKDKGFKKVDWVRRTRGVGILCGILNQDPIIAHRMRKGAKLFLGTIPASAPHWPLESLVMRLFKELDPIYFEEMKKKEAYLKSTKGRKETRLNLIKKVEGAKKCTKVKSPIHSQ